MWQIEVAQLLQVVGTVHARGLELLAVHALQRGHEDQRGKRQPLPGHHDDDRQQRPVGQPVDRGGTEEDPDLGQHAVDRVHHHVLPQQRIDRGHDEEGRDQQHAHQAAAGERLVDQQRQRNAQHHRDQDHAAQQQHGIEHRGPETGVGDKEDVVLQPDEAALVGLHQVVADDGEVDRHHQRHDHPEEERGDGRRHQDAGQESVHKHWE